MREGFMRKFNEMLVDTFNQIRKVEEASLKSITNNNLSISEYHLLECVGKNRSAGRTISEIAQDLSISSASVTVAINKLVRKEYVEKKKGTDDGRSVYVCLTKTGRRMNAGHRMFHENMVREVSKEFDSEELEMLLRCIEKLNTFFKQDCAGVVNAAK